MIHSKKLFAILVLVLGILNIATFRELRKLPDGSLRVDVLRVEKGRSVLLTAPSGKRIVIDGGGDLTALQSLTSHLPFFSKTIDLLVITKPSNDTVVSFPSLLDRFTVGAVLMTGTKAPLGAYEHFLSLVESQKIPTITPHPLMALDMGDGVTIHTLWPRKSLWQKEVTENELKDTAIVLRITSKDQTVLLLPSLSEEAERSLLQTGEDLRADTLVLLQPTGKSFPSIATLEAVKPSRVMIAAPKESSPDGPGNVLRRRLGGLGIRVGD
jgi:competence protein ComEC